MYKEKSTNGNLIHIGPPWDYDRAFDYDIPSTTDGWVWEITHPYWPFPFWWDKMWQDSVYRKELACRWFTLRENTLSNDSFMVMIDTLGARLNEAQARNFTLWNELGSQTYQDQLDSLKSYINRRLQWIDMTLAVENVSMPQSMLPTDTTICTGSLLDASIGLTGLGYSYNWMPGPDSATIMIQQSGDYTVKTEDQYGCFSKHTILVTLSEPDAGFSYLPLAGPNGQTWHFVPDDTTGSIYHWQLEDSIYVLNSYQESPIVTFTTAGWHTIVLTFTDSIGCQSTSEDSVLVIMPTGISEFAEKLLPLVYPNPNSEILNVEFPPSFRQNVHLALFNALGQVVFTLEAGIPSSTLKIPMAKLSAGIYRLVLQTDTDTTSILILRK